MFPLGSHGGPYLFVQEFKVSTTLIPTIDLVLRISLFGPVGIIASPGIVLIVIIVVCGSVQRIIILQRFFTIW